MTTDKDTNEITAEKVRELQSLIEEQRSVLRKFEVLFSCTEIQLGPDMCRQFKNTAEKIIGRSKARTWSPISEAIPDTLYWVAKMGCSNIRRGFYSTSGDCWLSAEPNEGVIWPDFILPFDFMPPVPGAESEED